MFRNFAKRRRPAGQSRCARANREQSRARRLGLESLESRQLLSATDATFHVVNDATANISYQYAADGAPQGTSSLVAANAAPRGAASTVATDRTWVIDANRNVYVYDTSGALLGSWAAGSMASNATTEGIATNGTDVWIVDSRSDKVFRYAGAASRLSGTQSAASSFSLNSGNTTPKDIVTDGASLWVVNDDKKTDKVFKYSVAGTLVGSWTISSANKTPTGITIDPANVGDIWIADSGTDRVYQYAAATSRNSGSQAASYNFALATGNANPQGLVVPGRPWAEAPHEVNWVRQLGSAGDDYGRGVAADDVGNVYLSGWTTGSLSVPNPTGTTTPFLARFDTTGNPYWVQQPNPVPGDPHEGVRVAADSLGNVFQVAGGGLNNYNAAGELMWHASLPSGEGTFGVTTDDLGYAYMSSYANGFAYLRKFDGTNGNILWTQSLNTGGTANSSGVSVDGLGNVYVAGYTYGSLIGPNAGLADGFVAKYSDAGDLLWTQQHGTAGYDFAFAVAADALGNVYTAGGVFASAEAFNSGDQDIFLTRYDSAGNLQWTQTLGTTANDQGASVWTDGLGNVYVSGASQGALGGPHLGAFDMVVAKYGTAGNLLWINQFGTSGNDVSSGGLTGDELGTFTSQAEPLAPGADRTLAVSMPCSSSFRRRPRPKAAAHLSSLARPRP